MIKKKKIFRGLIVIFLLGFIIPQDLKMPVQNATKADFNKDSFWYYPWGRSVTPKGVDIFAESGTIINSSTNGLVIYTGKIGLGGNFVLILGPKWRLHYYAHLGGIETSTLSLVSKKSKIGSVGSSGNAAGKAPHLHYSMMSIFPLVWRIDSDRQGWKKMFYLNPIDYLSNN